LHSRAETQLALIRQRICKPWFLMDHIASKIYGPRGVDVPCGDSFDSDEESGVGCRTHFTWSGKAATCPLTACDDDEDAVYSGLWIRAAPRSSHFMSEAFRAAPVGHTVVQVKSPVGLAPSPQHLSEASEEHMCMTPPRRRRLARQDTGECPSAPNIRHQPASVSQDRDKNDEDKSTLDPHTEGEDSVGKHWALTSEDNSYRMHLKLSEQGMFIDVNRRSRSRTPPCCRI
jgi:hypothetical protein